MLKQRNPLTVYQIAKHLGLSYGAAQWHVFVFEREGLVKTVKVGEKRLVYISPPREVSDSELADLFGRIAKAIRRGCPLSPLERELVEHARRLVVQYINKER